MSEDKTTIDEALEIIQRMEALESIGKTFGYFPQTRIQEQQERFSELARILRVEGLEADNHDFDRKSVVRKLKAHALIAENAIDEPLAKQRVMQTLGYPEGADSLDTLRTWIDAHNAGAHDAEGDFLRIAKYDLTRSPLDMGNMYRFENGELVELLPHAREIFVEGFKGIHNILSPVLAERYQDPQLPDSIVEFATNGTAYSFRRDAMMFHIKGHLYIDEGSDVTLNIPKLVSSYVHIALHAAQTHAIKRTNAPEYIQETGLPSEVVYNGVHRFIFEKVLDEIVGDEDLRGRLGLTDTFDDHVAIHKAQRVMQEYLGKFSAYCAMSMLNAEGELTFDPMYEDPREKAPEYGKISFDPQVGEQCYIQLLHEIVREDRVDIGVYAAVLCGSDVVTAALDRFESHGLTYDQNQEQIDALLLPGSYHGYSELMQMIDHAYGKAAPQTGGQLIAAPFGK